MNLRRILSELTPPIIKKIILPRAEYKEPMPLYTDPCIESYSQYNDDLIIEAILQIKNQGFYLDIGANHPELLSNTKRFYDKGWSGINVEPLPINYKLFTEQRLRDINLNLGIGNQEGELIFYSSNTSQGVFSSFNKKNILKYVKEKEITTTRVPVITMKTLLGKYLNGKSIDFVSIDVEGFEIEVLQGNDWSIFRPALIIIEFGDNGNEIVKFLENVNYKFVYSNRFNGIFLDQK